VLNGLHGLFGNGRTVRIMHVMTQAPAQNPNSATQATERTNTAPAPSLPLMARGIGITFGPSVLLDMLVAASVGTVVQQARAGWPGGRQARARQALASIGVGLTAAYLLAVRPWLRRWGATDAEVHETFPDDALVPDPVIETTWAVTIDAPLHDVWEWLAQIGQDRGGFYSYVWLENLAGCKMHNADRIHAEWQQRAPGEPVYLFPGRGLPVVRFEPDRSIALEGWGSFIVRSIDGQTTRLISRSRLPRGLPAISYALLLEIPHFIMQRKMLLGIKERAERATRARRMAEVGRFAAG
jgi:hypothetical protein